jgi:uncharacterized metal-binding protein YceD (DUF177 family)
LGKAFFEEHEVLEAKDGLIKVSVLLNKKSQLLSFGIVMEGYIEIPCDRCLEYFKYEINLDNELVVKFSDDSDESDEEVWYISPGEHEINLAQYFFDSIAIAIPLQKIHPVNPEDGSDGCDQEMLKILNKHAFSDNSKENDNDPRWDKLKNLLNDYNNN